MGKEDQKLSSPGPIPNAFRKAADQGIAERIEGIALELRGANSPTPGVFASGETLGTLAFTLQKTLARIDEIFESEGFVFSPACDIMLELFQARVRGSLVSMPALLQAAKCPGPVTRRWIDVLDGMQLLEKLGDDADGPRVTITEKGYLRTAQALQLLL